MKALLVSVRIKNETLKALKLFVDLVAASVTDRHEVLAMLPGLDKVFLGFINSPELEVVVPC